jgi:hypothetical protein
MTNEAVWLASLAELEAWAAAHDGAKPKQGADATEQRLASWMGHQQKNCHDGVRKYGMKVERVHDAWLAHVAARADWYAAFARWKTATVVQQLHHRWVVGDSTDERMATVADGIGRLIGGAEMFIAADKGN